VTIIAAVIYTITAAIEAFMTPTEINCWLEECIVGVVGGVTS
jgi:hypothetical protein